MSAFDDARAGGVIDTLVGLPPGPGDTSWRDDLRPLLKDAESLGGFQHPASYMFKNLPDARYADDPPRARRRTSSSSHAPASNQAHDKVSSPGFGSPSSSATRWVTMLLRPMSLSGGMSSNSTSRLLIRIMTTANRKPANTS